MRSLIHELVYTITLSVLAPPRPVLPFPALASSPDEDEGWTVASGASEEVVLVVPSRLPVPVCEAALLLLLALPPRPRNPPLLPFSRGTNGRPTADTMKNMPALERSE